MEIILSNASDRPIYEQITSQIKEMIMKGELKPGEPMPSMRRLARDLHVSVITTQRAYDAARVLSATVNFGLNRKLVFHKGRKPAQDRKTPV